MPNVVCRERRFDAGDRYTIENFVRSNRIILAGPRVPTGGALGWARSTPVSSETKRKLAKLTPTRCTHRVMPDGDSFSAPPFRAAPLPLLLPPLLSPLPPPPRSSAFHARHARSVDHKGKRIGKFHCNFSPRLSISLGLLRNTIIGDFS